MTENLSFTSMDLKEHVEEVCQKQDRFLNKHTGYIGDSDTRDFLNYFSNEWSTIKNDELPENEYESQLFIKVIRKEATDLVSEAIDEGNISQMKYVTGYRNKNKDFSGLDLYKKLIKRVSRDGYISYIYGDLGSGKTDFALLLSELWKIDKDGEIGSNIKSFKEKDQEILVFSELSDWLEKNNEAKLFVFDEASSYAHGYGKQGYNAQNLIHLLKKFRKYNASLIIIGHTGKDIHPEIRRLSTDVIEKVSKKKAVFYDSIQDGEGRNKQLEIEEIPKTSYRYDTKELTKWKWN